MRSSDRNLNDGAFTQLYLAERLPMVRLAALLLGSSINAEEVVQDAFFQVSENWDGIENHGGYLRTTVVNGCRAKLRRRTVENQYLESSKPLSDIQDHLPDHLVELEQALSKLNERGRAVVVLRHLLGLSDSEIAETLGLTPSGVRTIRSKAFKTLRKELR